MSRAVAGFGAGQDVSILSRGLFVSSEGPREKRAECSLSYLKRAVLEAVGPRQEPQISMEYGSSMDTRISTVDERDLGVSTAGEMTVRRLIGRLGGNRRPDLVVEIERLEALIDALPTDKDEATRDRQLRDEPSIVSVFRRSVSRVPAEPDSP